MSRYSYKKVHRGIDAKSITIRLVDTTEDKVLHLTRFKSEKLQKPLFVAKDNHNSYITTRKYTLLLELVLVPSINVQNIAVQREQ